MNLGYACINMNLSGLPKSKRVTTNRSMVKKTFKERGITYASELALQNCRDLLTILEWNEENDVKFFRLSSDLFPWSSEYNIRDLPDFENIALALDEAGEFAGYNSHRITTHPGPFNVLGSPREDVVDKTIKELETHSEVFDLMGLEATPYAKINIHVGGTYGGDFAGTAERWCRNFFKLSPNAQNRVTLENDDKASFCTGGQTEGEAVQLAASTWHGIKPVVHLSESRRAEQKDEKIRVQAHSDYIYKPVDNYGVDYDMMLECKKKELGLLRYRAILNMEAQIYGSEEEAYC